MSHRIFLTGSGIAPSAVAVLQEHQCIIETGDPQDSPAGLERKLRQFNPDALIVRQGLINAEVQDAASSLKVICKHGVGTDNIDIAYATARGIPVLFTPGSNTQSAAEHALGLVLSLTRSITRENMRVRNGTFEKKRYDGIELAGKTLGLLGYGRIGKKLAQLVEPFGLEVLVFHPSACEEAAPPHVHRASTPEEVFERSDIISLHCSLNDSTRGMINRESLKMMKSGVYLINTARGAIIRQDALIEALATGRVAGAALDVFEEEPLPKDHPLLSQDNVIVTPHVAGISDRSFIRMGLTAVQNVLAILNGGDLDRACMVNPEVLSCNDPSSPNPGTAA